MIIDFSDFKKFFYIKVIDHIKCMFIIFFSSQIGLFANALEGVKVKDLISNIGAGAAAPAAAAPVAAAPAAAAGKKEEPKKEEKKKEESEDEDMGGFGNLFSQLANTKYILVRVFINF